MIALISIIDNDHGDNQMKKGPKPITIVLIIALIIFLLPIVSFFAIFHYNWLPEEARQRRAEISAKKHEDEAFEEAADYLDDHFDDFDEDDIIDVSWLRHDPYIFGMPGSSLHLAIENKGETFYFTVYSEKDDIEFEVVVDSPKKKDTFDTYEDNILRHDAIMTYVQLFEPIGSQFEKIVLNGDWRDFYQIYEDTTQNNYDVMIQDLNTLLSQIQGTELKTDYPKHRSMESFTIEFYVDRNALEYCKENRDVLTRLNDEYAIMCDQLEELKSTHLFITIFTKDGCNLNFYNNSELSVRADSQDGPDFKEPISEFVKRDTFVSSQSSGE